MITAGMNALVRRSWTCNSVRTLATNAKPGGSGRNNRHGGNQFRKGGEQPKPQAGTKPEPKPVPSLKTQPRGEQPKLRAGTKPELKPAPPLKTNPAHKLEHTSRKQENIPRKQDNAPRKQDNVPRKQDNAPRKAEHTSHKAEHTQNPNRPPQKPGQKPPKPKPTPVAAPAPAPAPTPTTSLEPPTTENGNRNEGDTPQTVTPLSAYTLPAAQLRALIDLYHSSASYITPETLSSAIDDTFAPRRFRFSTSTRYQSYGDLIAQRDERDAEPDRVVPSVNELSGRGYGAAGSISQALSEGGWSESKDERARMVRAALWGVDPLAKIGLETLLEAKVELDVQDKEPEEKK